MPALLRLDALAGGQDLALLALRLLTGAFLVTVMWPNISDRATMAEVIGFFRDAGFVYPEIFGPLSAWAQFLIGIALILGLLTRIAGLALAFNFMVGMIMVHLDDPFRGMWPALSLLLTGLVLAAFGAGRFALDGPVRAGWLALGGLARAQDAVLLLLRLVTGAFLIHGVWDNVTSAERMAEFTGFLTQFNFPMPELMAPLSVYAQLVIGVLLILGLLTRWAGLLLMFNFIVAVWMVHWGESFRLVWPAAILIAFGFVFATIGAGALSADRALARK